MAYTQVQVLSDTDRRHAVKRINSGNTEAAVLFVNAAALAHALQTITTEASANTFKVGETVSTTNTNGVVATVLDVVNSTTIIVTTANGTFGNAGVITGATSGVTRTQSGNAVPFTYDLQVARIIYDVKGSTGAEKVSLLWEGTGGGANNRTIAILSGSGVLELDTHAVRVINNANTPTGNILITTDAWDANSHYTLILDISKREGYAMPRTLFGAA